MRYITEGFKVCVACEPPAMQNNSSSCQGDGQESDKYEVMNFQMHVLTAVQLHVYSGSFKYGSKKTSCIFFLDLPFNIQS